MPVKISAFADESSKNFEEQLDAVKRNGITHIELRGMNENSINNASLDDVRAVKKEADAVGIKFSAVGSGLGKCGVNDDMGPQIALCRHLVEAAHILETPYIRMFSFRIPKEENADDYRQQVMDQMGLLVDAVDGTGVMLAHENEHGIYGDIGRRCLDLYETFYSTGNFKGVFDFANFLGCGEVPLKDCWPLLKNYTEYFHIKDYSLEDQRVVPAGEGDGGMPEILGEAIANGFDSFLTLEPHLWPRYFEGTPEDRFDLASQKLHKLLNAIQK